jgi:ankyrin repeat protein
MIRTKYLIFVVLILHLTGCNTNQSMARTETDDDLIEAILYHHEFKVSAIIKDLKYQDNIDRLILTERVSSGINRWTPLCFASFMGNRKATIELIENGASVNFKDANGQSPIILAAIAGNPEEIDILLKNGANINDTDKNGSTPLIHAASEGNIETVRYLVKSGCIIKPTSGQSALDFAIFHQQDEVIKYLKKIELKK